MRVSLTLPLVLVSLLVSDPGLTRADDAASNGTPTGGHVVRFAPGAEGSKLAPRFSPKGTQVTLTPRDMPQLAGKDHLVGRITLGPKETQGGGQLVALARSTPGKPYDLLFVDSNLDGSLADEKTVAAKPNVVRDKWWSSFNAVTLKVNHAGPNTKPALSDYPVSFWVVVEKPDETPTVVRFSRRGYMVGTVTVGETTYNVAVTDMNNDGVIGRGDSWTIGLAERDDPLGVKDWRGTSDFCWAGGKAWKLAMDGTAGGAGRVAPFDPGITQEADEAARDRYKADREAPRAAKPVHFEKDYEAALKLAAEAGKPVYVKFETDWCGPCKTMSAYVFTAKEVADAAQGVVCVTVDGDKRKDLTQKFNIGGYPTGVLLDATGKELARADGYRSVKAMSEFLKRGKK